MHLDWIRRDSRRIALFAAPAFALALAACGGDGADVTSADTAAPAAVVEEASSTEAPADDTADSAAAPAAEPEATDTSAADEGSPAASSRPAIVRLSADEAIANAESNQPNLQPSSNVLDIETLAVADGSVQTLRDVVDGDRPVLLWFFSPH